MAEEDGTGQSADLEAAETDTAPQPEEPSGLAEEDIILRTVKNNWTLRPLKNLPRMRRRRIPSLITPKRTSMTSRTMKWTNSVLADMVRILNNFSYSWYPLVGQYCGIRGNTGRYWNYRYFWNTRRNQWYCYSKFGKSWFVLMIFIFPSRTTMWYKNEMEKNLLSQRQYLLVEMQKIYLAHCWTSPIQTWGRSNCSRDQKRQWGQT